MILRYIIHRNYLVLYMCPVTFRGRYNKSGKLINLCFLYGETKSNIIYLFQKWSETMTLDNRKKYLQNVYKLNKQILPILVFMNAAVRL